MAVDPLIARPYIPDVSNTLGEIARTRVADNYRNALLAQDQQRFAYQQQKDQAANQQLADEQKLRETYAEIEMYANAPPAIKAQYVETQKQKYPNFAQTPFASMPPEQAFEAMRAGLRAKLGMDNRQPQIGVGGIGNYNPGDYTPQSFARFLQTKNPADLQRYVTPAQDKVVVIDGVPNMVNPRSHERTPLSTLPDTIASKQAIAAATAAGTAQGKSTAAAQADLPRVEANADSILTNLRAFRDHEGTRYLYGGYSLAPVVPGTPQADANAMLEQIGGKAFLEAFNTLKGGGQITEKEGEKATAAITRLINRRQSYAGAVKAMKELEEVVQAGVDRARKKTGGQTSEQTGTTRRRYNPATGKIE